MNARKLLPLIFCAFLLNGCGPSGNSVAKSQFLAKQETARPPLETNKEIVKNELPEKPLPPEKSNPPQKPNPSAEPIAPDTFFTKLHERKINYGTPSINQAITNKRLKGVFNVRQVIPGFIYRAGSGGGADFLPLSDQALQNLCREGFSEILDVRGKNSKVKPATIHCKKDDGTDHTMNYGIATYSKPETYLVMIQNRLNSHKDPGPILLHCAGGEHRSGYASAAVLMQFCDYSVSEAQQYWLTNRKAKKWDQEFITKISDFPKRSYQETLVLNPEVKEKVCPD